MNTDYKTEALGILLNEDCVLKRFYPLIPHKDKMISVFLQMGARRKSEIASLSDEELENASLTDPALRRLFRAFLNLYDPNPKKVRDIEHASLSMEQDAAFRELMLLPGVKTIRATLYYKAGFRELSDIASASPDEIIKRTKRVIEDENLPMSAPFMKEVKTHIAVAKAFTSNT